MRLKLLSISAIGLMVLSACGGGGGGGVTADTMAPSISGVTVSAPSNGKVTLTASASDNTGITGYCFKNGTTAPAAGDACFSATPAKDIDTPIINSPAYYLWVKDAASNLSTMFSVDTTAPSISGVALSAPSNGKVSLTASASDNKEVTGYCLKTDATVPVAGNACFTTDAAKLIDVPATDITYFAWTKDAAGNVSTAFTKALTDAVAPVVSGVSVSPPISGQLTLTVSASDTKGVTGYCFKTNATAPAANDACFNAAVTKIISTPQTTAHYVWTKDAAGNISSAYAAGCSAAGVTASQNSALPTVCVSTSLGEFVVALESTKAPITTTNFLKYVNDGFYSQTVFHRVMSNFMVQGGGYTGVPISPANAKVGTVYDPIALETTTQTGLSNTTGTIAMARLTPVNTATHEFYINVVDNLLLNTSNLSGGYAVFGNVISGLNTTVQSIRGLPVQDNGRYEISQPLVPPVINWAYQLK